MSTAARLALVLASVLIGTMSAAASPTPRLSNAELQPFTHGGVSTSEPAPDLPAGFRSAHIAGLAMKIAVYSIVPLVNSDDDVAGPVLVRYGKLLAHAGYDVLVVHSRFALPGGMIVTGGSIYTRMPNESFVHYEHGPLNDVLAGHSI